MDSDDGDDVPKRPSKRRPILIFDDDDSEPEGAAVPKGTNGQADAIVLDDEPLQDVQTTASFADTYLAFFFERSLPAHLVNILSTQNTSLSRVETAWVAEKKPDTTWLVSRDIFRVAEQHYELVKGLTFVGAVQGRLGNFAPKVPVQDCLRDDIQKLVRESYRRRVQRGQTPVDSEDAYVASYTDADVKERMALLKELTTFNVSRLMASGRAACSRLAAQNDYLRNVSDDVLLDERLREYFQQKAVAQSMTNRSDRKHQHYDELLKVWSRVALAHLSIRLLKDIVDTVRAYHAHHANSARATRFAGITLEQYNECVIESLFPVPVPRPFSVAQVLNACDLASRYAEGKDVTPPYQSF